MPPITATAINPKVFADVHKVNNESKHNEVKNIAAKVDSQVSFHQALKEVTPRTNIISTDFLDSSKNYTSSPSSKGVKNIPNTTSAQDAASTSDKARALGSANSSSLPTQQLMTYILLRQLYKLNFLQSHNTEEEHSMAQQIYIDQWAEEMVDLILPATSFAHNSTNTSVLKDSVGQTAKDDKGLKGK